MADDADVDPPRRRDRARSRRSAARTPPARPPPRPRRSSSEPLEVHTAGGDRTISSDQLRSWVRLTSNPDGTVVVTLDDAAVAAGLRRAFADVDGHPVERQLHPRGRRPGDPSRPARQGVLRRRRRPPRSSPRCRAAPARSSSTLVDGPAPFTAADAEAYGIKQPVGGNNAWRSGAPTTAGPGFTTYHDASGARVTNIHRIADLVRGAVIPPGGQLLDQRLRGRAHRREGLRGGRGHPQRRARRRRSAAASRSSPPRCSTPPTSPGSRSTTSQAHSEYFDRYPRGREATMGYPAPDLAFTNNTPYGIMIWTSYTDTSLTVTLYSTPYATRRADRRSSRARRASAPSSPPPARSPTRTARRRSDKFRASYRPRRRAAPAEAT